MSKPESEIGEKKVLDVSVKAERGVQSVVRGFSILEAIAKRPEGISLSDLSRAVDLHSSTTFHLVRTLAQLGYVRQDRDSKRYVLGRELYRLASATMDEVRLKQIARPFVERLSRETGETAHFAVPSRDSVAILVKTQGTSAFQLSDVMGAIRPRHATAIGKVILASLSSDTLEQKLRSMELAQFTAHTITEPARLRDEMATVRETGVGYDDAEYHPELRCAAVPVRGMDGEVIGALGISGAIWRLSLSGLQGKVSVLQGMAGELSAELGYWPR